MAYNAIIMTIQINAAFAKLAFIGPEELLAAQ
jgi:hypothetical protein